jgi:restriction endonuclease Mrr
MTGLEREVSDALARAIVIHVERDVFAHELLPQERAELAKAVVARVFENLREPTPAMLDAFVARALQVSVQGEGGWTNYARNQWQTMLDAALRHD